MLDDGVDVGDVVPGAPVVDAAGTVAGIDLRVDGGDLINAKHSRKKIIEMVSHLVEVNFALF